jgi:hypothetical protein
MTHHTSVQIAALAGRADNRLSALEQAAALYARTRSRGQRRGLGLGPAGRSRCLLSLDEVDPGDVHAWPCEGNQQVPITQIQGSEGRSGDFDREFRPLQDRTRERWLSVAAARQQGKALPPVELIQVGPIYFVRDGHHRISVARALGQQAIEARVLVWQVTGPLPWEVQSSASRPGKSVLSAVQAGLKTAAASVAAAAGG